MIALLLEHWRLLPHPLLYLSLFFRRHQAEYYRRSSRVRTDGDWEGWVDFFLDGVATVGEEAVVLARELFALVAEDRSRLLESDSASLAAVRLFEMLPAHPIVTVNAAIKLLDTTKPTAGKAVDALEDAGILRETTGRLRDRSFSYEAYLKKLGAGTEL